MATPQLFNQGSDSARRAFASAFNIEYHQAAELRQQRNQWLTPGFASSQNNTTDSDYFLGDVLAEAAERNAVKSRQDRTTDEELFVKDMVYKQLQHPEVAQIVTYQTFSKEMCSDEAPLKEIVEMEAHTFLVEKVVKRLDDGSYSVQYRTSLAPAGSKASTVITAPSEPIPITSSSSSPRPGSRSPRSVSPLPYRSPKRMSTLDRKLLDPSQVNTYHTSSASDYFL